MIVSNRVKDTLEFERVLSLIAGEAVSELGRRRVMALVPLSSWQELSGELDRLAEMCSITSGSSMFVPPEVPILAEQLARLTMPGVVLEGDEIVAFSRLFEGAQLARGYILRRQDALPALSLMASRLEGFEQLNNDIARTFDENNEVRSSASPLLGRLRKDARNLRERLEKRLTDMAAKLTGEGSAGENFVTLRQERYVIAVLRNEMHTCPGIIQGESGSGNTLFIEPEQMVSLNNRLREVELDIRREIVRILASLSSELAAEREQLRTDMDTLAELDSLFARARFADIYNCNRPALGDGERLRIFNARHPLLAARQEQAVPLSLELEEGERTLLVSGPNAGGKTVMLKTVGLAAMMTQSGIFPLLDEGSSLPMFGNVLVAIGDEQSIDKDLSSFSSHVMELKEALEQGDSHSLVLLDEIGAGTDPAEGAAVAAAVLENLTRRGCLTLSTTHYGELKLLFEQVSGLVNGSLEFDPDKLAPTFVFHKGLPGRSYGLEIAGNMGIDKDVLGRAREFMGGDVVNRESYLVALEEQQRRLNELIESARMRDRKSEEREREIKRRQSDWERRTRKLAELEKSFDKRMERKVRDSLLESRKDVEAAISRLEDEYRQDSQQAARRARQELENKIRAMESKALGQQQPMEKITAGVDPGELSEGDRVSVPSMGFAGEVASGPDSVGNFTVVAGRVKISVSPSEMVKLVSGDSKKNVGFEFTPSADESEGKETSRLDIRGIRVDEVSYELDRFLSAAVLDNLSEVVILHGKGTGALRARVSELLGDDRRVETIRPGQWNEGGTGVTVVRLAR
jgi:DNA mismatch repair protein MutS2